MHGPQFGTASGIAARCTFATLQLGDFRWPTFLFRARFLLNKRRPALPFMGVGVIKLEVVQVSFWGFSYMVSTEATNVVMLCDGDWLSQGAEVELMASVLGEAVPLNQLNHSGAQNHNAPSPCSDDSIWSKSGFLSIVFR